jgi:hypothetical protein
MQIKDLDPIKSNPMWRIGFNSLKKEIYRSENNKSKVKSRNKKSPEMEPGFFWCLKIGY